ncbi:MAG: metallophosphoesterase [Actinomycetia bacterium]|nr:metallophosphoesterase [Actinomycetes bacterium]
MKFIATADWQLGMAAAFLDDEARPRFVQARFDAITRIGALARERDAAFVVVAGDVFESNHLDRSIVARAFEALRQVPVPVYLLPGNHDPLDASAIYRSPQFRRGCPDHVAVLDSTDPVRVGDTEIIGVPWHTKRPLSDLVADALDDLAPTDVRRVLVAHGRVDSLNPDRHDPAVVDEAMLRAAVDDDRVRFAVLGDRHATYRVHDRIWYPGTPEVTARREIDPGNALIVDLDADVPNVEKVRVGAWTFAEHEAELTHDDDLVALESALGERVDKDRTALWLRLRGSLSVTQRARLDDIIEAAADVHAAVTLADAGNDLVVVPDGHDFGDLALGGASSSAVDELVHQAGSDATDARVAQDALGLLYRLTRSDR